jgi:hypothetical protein
MLEEVPWSEHGRRFIELKWRKSMKKPRELKIFCDNFFELGGHSLLALQLLPKMREKFQVALEPRELFANSTIAKL